jgi:oligopeptide/dipeptide ABC transporter ATP-binding protein
MEPVSGGALAVHPPPEPLLEVRELAIDLARPGNPTLPVVAEASFEVPRGAILGLFGESGCGKTTLALALPGLLARERYRVRGSVKLRGREILGLPESRLQRVRGAHIAFIFQDPLLALNPVLRIRTQFSEALRAHTAGQPDIDSLLRLAGLPATPRIRDAYPHQLSGGERQRVLIALALSCRPALVIADEPFTALDAARVVELSALFVDLKQKLGVSFLLIDHSPAVLARIADYALVMYAGRIVERGTPRQLTPNPMHPYTAGLLRSIPRPVAGGKRLPCIPGNPPGLDARPSGCPFEPRCGVRMERCASLAPPEYIVADGRAVRCFKYAG